jgi:hypothetical protein
MATSASISDIQTESNVKIIECKFASEDERNLFYKLAEEQIIRIACLRNGPFFSDDANVVSIGYEPEYRERVMNFIDKYYLPYDVSPA